MAEIPITNLNQINTLEELNRVLNDTLDSGLENAVSTTYMSRTFKLIGSTNSQFDAKMEDIIKKFNDLVKMASDNPNINQEQLESLVTNCHDILVELDVVGDAKLEEGGGSKRLRNFFNFRWFSSHHDALDKIENEHVFNKPYVTSENKTITYSQKAEELIHAYHKSEGEKDEMVSAIIREHFPTSRQVPLQNIKERSLLRCIADKDPVFAKDILIKMKNDFPKIKEDPELRNFVNSLMVVSLAKRDHDFAVAKILKQDNPLFDHIHGSKKVLVPETKTVQVNKVLQTNIVENKIENKWIKDFESSFNKLIPDRIKSQMKEGTGGQSNKDVLNIVKKASLAASKDNLSNKKLYENIINELKLYKENPENIVSLPAANNALKIIQSYQEMETVVDFLNDKIKNNNFFSDNVTLKAEVKYENGSLACEFMVKGTGWESETSDIAEKYIRTILNKLELDPIKVDSTGRGLGGDRKVTCTFDPYVIRAGIEKKPPKTDNEIINALNKLTQMQWKKAESGSFELE